MVGGEAAECHIGADILTFIKTSERRPRSTGCVVLVALCLNSITHGEPRLMEAISLSKRLGLSTCALMPCV